MSAEPPQGRYNAQETALDDPLAAIRATMRQAHADGLSWGKMAGLLGISKALAYRVALEGYTPKDPELMKKLTGDCRKIEFVKIERNGSGRFVAGASTVNDPTAKAGGLRGDGSRPSNRDASVD